MGFLDRVWKVTTGIGGAAQAPFGLVKDLATAWNMDDEDFDGLWHTLQARTTERGAQLLGNVFGPEEGVGALVGGLPETGVRDPLRPVVRGFNSVTEGMYREGISEPLTTLMTVGSLADSDKFGAGMGGWAAFADPAAWRLGYKVAQDRSPGQAIALAILTNDILDEDEVLKAQGTDFYGIASGVTDAIIRMRLDPTALIGASGKSFLKATDITRFEKLNDVGTMAGLTKKLGSVEQAEQVVQKTHRAHIDTYVKSHHWTGVNDDLGRIVEESADAATAAGTIRAKYFPKLAQGERASTFLANAKTAEERTLILRVLAGDLTALQLLENESSVAASRLTDLISDQHLLTSKLENPAYHRSSVYTHRQKLADVDGQIEEIQRQLDIYNPEDLEKATFAVEQAPTLSGRRIQGYRTRIRGAEHANDLLQTNQFFRPVRVFRNMVPHRLIDTSMSGGDVQLDRMLRDTGLPVERRDWYRGQYMESTPEARVSLVEAAEEEGFSAIAREMKMEPEEIKRIIAGSKEYRRVSMNLLRENRYDARGRTRIRSLDDADEIFDYPIASTQLSTTAATVDFQQVRKELTRVRRIKNKYKFTQAPEQLMDNVMKVWRPSMLLRPAWPIRVVGDEQMRIAAKMGALTQGNKALKKYINDYAGWKQKSRSFAAQMANNTNYWWAGGTGAVFGAVVAGPVGAVMMGAVGVGGKYFARNMDEIPYGQLITNGTRAQGAFGDPGDTNNIIREQVSAGRSLDDFLRKDSDMSKKMADASGAWRTVTGQDPYHGRDWEKVVNGTIAPDPLAQIILSHDHPPPGIEPPPPPGYTPPKPKGRGPARPPFVPELSGVRSADESVASLHAMADEDGGKLWTGGHYQTYDPTWGDTPDMGDQMAQLAINSREHATSVAHVSPDNVILPDVEISKARLKRLSKNPYQEGVPLMLKVDDMYYVADGVDQYVVAYNRGMPIQAHVVDLDQIDDVTPEISQLAKSELEGAWHNAQENNQGVRLYPNQGLSTVTRVQPKNPYPATTTVAAAPPPGWTSDPMQMSIPGNVPWHQKADISGIGEQPQIYHATTNWQGVMNEGLRSGQELGTTALAGTPGWVSMTYDPNHATNIATMMRLHVRAARDELSYSDLFNEFNSHYDNLLDEMDDAEMFSVMGMHDTYVQETLRNDPFWTPNDMDDLAQFLGDAKAAGYAVQDPFNILRSFDEHLGEWTEKVHGPDMRHATVGIYTDKADLAKYDPDQIGIVNVAVPKNPSDAQLVPGEFEFRIRPEEVMVLSGAEHPGYSVLRSKLDDPNYPNLIDGITDPDYNVIAADQFAQHNPLYFDPDQFDINEMHETDWDAHQGGVPFMTVGTSDPQMVMVEGGVDAGRVKSMVQRIRDGEDLNASELPWGFIAPDSSPYIVRNAETVMAYRILGKKNFPFLENAELDAHFRGVGNPDIADMHVQPFAGVEAQGFTATGQAVNSPRFTGAGPGQTVPPPPGPPPAPPAGFGPGGAGAPGGPIRWDGRTAAKWWLKNTPEGRKYQKLMPVRSKDTDQWVDTFADIIDDLTVKDPKIAGSLLDPEGRATIDQLHEMFTIPKDSVGADEVSPRWHVNDNGDYVDVDSMPMVHGPQAVQLVGGNPVMEMINRWVDKGMHTFGTLPTDALSRNDYFAKIYAYEMNRRMAQIAPGSIPERMLRNFEKSAREKALYETRELLYDLAERSQFGEMMRNVLPFYSAWQEVLTRWSGLLVENPAFARKASMVLGAPNKMNATYKDPDTGEEYVQFRIPEFARGLIGHGLFKDAIDSQGQIRLDKNGFNMVSQGLPGFGPFVQVALKPFVDAHPELEESLKVVFPFGPPQGIKDVFLPPSARRAMEAGTQRGRGYMNARNRIIQTHLVNMNLGKEEKLDLNDPEVRSQFLQDTEDEARSFASFKFIAGSLSPVAPIYESPYQMYIEEYRKMQDADPESADDKFLDEFGEEFFPLTQAFTKINDGVNPSAKGYQARAKYEALIEAHPEYGSLIIGDEGGGEAVKFSSAVYAQQLSHPVRPGSETMQRTPLTAEEMVSEPDTRLGWVEFTRQMKLIKVTQQAQGLPNLQVKAAAPLRALKDTIINIIAMKHPSWYAEYSMTNELKWSQKIDSLESIAANAQLAQRPDIAMLKKYLNMREGIVGLLSTREHHGLNADSNRDIQILYETLVDRMKSGAGGLAFEDLYDRWLSNDPVTPVDPAARQKRQKEVA